jgi:hypothetical protein
VFDNHISRPLSINPSNAINIANTNAIQNLAGHQDLPAYIKDHINELSSTVSSTILPQVYPTIMK